MVNQKGGVSKTTTTVNLGAGLASLGYQVLLIDLDSQCNLTQSLVGDLEDGERCIADCMLEEKGFSSVIKPTKTQNLQVVPAGETMTGIDLNLVGVLSREGVLKRCIKKTDLKGIDFILIDTAPYISLLTVNALVASTHYLVPTTAEYLPLRGIEKLNQNVERVKDTLNSSLELLGVVITQYDTRKAITSQIEEALKEELGESLFDTRVRINTKFSSSPIEQETIFQYEQEKHGKGSQDYQALTQEVLQRLNIRTQEAASNG
jgi:chromosome partitioning protein